MSNIDSLLLYILIFAISTFSFSQYKVENSLTRGLGISLSIVIPSIFAGVRFQVGTDYKNYLYTFKALDNLPFKWIFTNELHLNMERGFLFASKLALYVFSPRAIFGVWAFIILLFFVITLVRYYRQYDITLAYFVFLIGPFTNSFNVLRQEVAIAIVFFAIHYIFENKFIKYLIFILIAGTIHFSAFVCIVIYFLWNHKTASCAHVNKIKGWKYILLGLILLAIWRPVLARLSNTGLFFIEKFNEYQTGNVGRNLSFIIMLFVLLFLFGFEDSIGRDDEVVHFFILLYLIATIAEFTGFFSTFVKRIGLYFSVGTAIIYTNIPFAFTERSRLFVKWIICGLLLMEFVLSSFVLKQGGLIPYKVN